MKSRAAVAFAAGPPLQIVEIDVEPFITHTLPLERINEAFDLMHAGTSIRTVIHF